MPTALVTGTPEWVSSVSVALKSEGFDILSGGSDPALWPPSLRCDLHVHATPGTPPGISEGRRPAWPSYLEVDPEMGFADWRDEILCLRSAGN